MFNKLFILSLFSLGYSKPVLNIDTCNEITVPHVDNSSCLVCQMGVGLMKVENKFLNYTYNQTQNSIQAICNASNTTSMPGVESECYYLSNNTFNILNLTKYNTSVTDICKRMRLC
jgi:hypothetical protein